VCARRSAAWSGGRCVRAAGDSGWLSRSISIVDDGAERSAGYALRLGGYRDAFECGSDRLAAKSFCLHPAYARPLAMWYGSLTSKQIPLTSPEIPLTSPEIPLTSRKFSHISRKTSHALPTFCVSE
jgi:hypothetical protein